MARLHLIEYLSLGNVTRTGHLVDDDRSNTYRALRCVGSARWGEFLYAEFTALADWNFTAVAFREAFDVRADPYMLDNVWARLAPENQSALADELRARWRCAGTDGDDACACRAPPRARAPCERACESASAALHERDSSKAPSRASSHRSLSRALKIERTASKPAATVGAGAAARSRRSMATDT